MDIFITETCFVKGQEVEKGSILKDLDVTSVGQLLSSGRARIARDEDITQKTPKKAAKKAAKVKDES